ncbi:MAG: carboxypeptidase-like regulatory domain-containing protein [Opitutus sp.]
MKSDLIHDESLRFVFPSKLSVFIIWLMSALDMELRHAVSQILRAALGMAFCWVLNLPAKAGLSYYTDVVQAVSGQPVKDARVFVTAAGTKTPAKLYDDKEGLRETPNPQATNARGRFRFYLRSGNYDLHIAGSGVEYAMTDVTIIDPSEPHSVNSSAQAPALTLVEKAEKTRGNNIPLLFNRPGSIDANNLTKPYRIVVNKGELGWGLTWNADWDEIAGNWTERDLPSRTFFFRINGLNQALEYGNDYRKIAGIPKMETLFRVESTGEAHFKSQGGTVSIEVRNDVKIGGRAVNVSRNQVVVLDPTRPFTIIAPRRQGDVNAVIVTGAHPNDNSRVYVLIAGRHKVETPYSAKNIDDKIVSGANLVTEGAGSLRAVIGPADADPRSVLGWIHDKSNGFWAIVP